MYIIHTYIYIRINVIYALFHAPSRTRVENVYARRSYTYIYKRVYMYVRIIGSAKNAGAKLRIRRRYRGGRPLIRSAFMLYRARIIPAVDPSVPDDWPRILNADDSPPPLRCTLTMVRWLRRCIRPYYFYTCFRTPMRISTRNSARTFNWKSSFSVAVRSNLTGRFRPMTIVFCLFSFTPKERRRKCTYVAARQDRGLDTIPLSS